jgi:hypothetical protein
MPPHSMRRVKLDTLTTPKNGLVQIYCDSWWAVSNQDEVYFFGTPQRPFGSPQCNPNAKIARKLVGLSTAAREDCRLVDFKEIRRIPVVLVPVNASDYY